MKETKGFVYLDKNTDFTGIVESSQLILEGSMTGEIHATEEVFLRKGCFLKGDINTKKVLVEEGYHHEGVLKLVTENKSTETVSKSPASREDAAEVRSNLKDAETGADVPVHEINEGERQPSSRLW